MISKFIKIRKNDYKKTSCYFMLRPLRREARQFLNNEKTFRDRGSGFK